MKYYTQFFFASIAVAIIAGILESAAVMGPLVTALTIVAVLLMAASLVNFLTDS